MIEFMLKVYRNKKKDYLFLLCIMSILATFEFFALAIYNSLQNIQTDFISALSNNIFPTFLAFITLFLISYVLKYFIQHKKQEFSILLLSGRNIKDLFFYMIFQYGIISFIAFVLGIFFGHCFIILMNMTLKIFNISFIFQYSFIDTCFIHIFFFLFTVIFALSICSYQFNTMTIHLVEFLNHKKIEQTDIMKTYLRSVSEDKKKNPIAQIFFTIIIVAAIINSLYSLLINELNSSLLHYMLVIGGTPVIINMIIPLVYDLFHTQLMKKPIFINALTCFKDFSKTMMTLITLNSVIVPSIIIIMMTCGGNPYLKIIIVPCFMMIFIMMGLCFILRYSYYKEQLKPNLTIFYALGYKYNQLNSILRMKNILFLILGVFIPFVLFAVIAYKTYLLNYINIETFVILSIIYLSIYIFIFIYMSLKEIKMIKEVF